MKRAEELKLRASLIQAMEAWAEGPAEQLSAPLPMLGDSTLIHMAEAALGVLLAVDDLFDYLRDSDLLKEDDE